jgi:hypothetical protein
VEAVTLTEFLVERLNEDEADVARIDGVNWSADRVLSEVGAKRRIVRLGPSECGGHEDQELLGGHHYPDPAWQNCDGCSAAESSDAVWRAALRALAMPYADHPDYRPEWKP